jgi:hypothetical protein
LNPEAGAGSSTYLPHVDKRVPSPDPDDLPMALARLINLMFTLQSPKSIERALRALGKRVTVVLEDVA